MKEVDIVSKIVNREGEAKASPSKGIQSINLSDYLLKSVWDKVFEIRTDSQGTEYIFVKLPMVTQYGITMYSGDGVDIPSLASGLPFDGRTIWYNPDTQQIEVIGGTGGGSGEGVSNFWDLSGIPSWITISKPKYTYSEIEGTPDLTKYALVSQIPSLSGYATESWVTKQNYATRATTLSGYGITDAYTKTNVDDLLKSYVTLGGTQTITGEKNFTGGLKVNGSPIYYDTEKKYWKLEGDLLVTGGVTMYGSDSSFTPSTIMDAIAVDGTTISKSGGVLKVIGGTGGGVADSVAWANITGKPTWIGSSKPTYSYSEITGAISTTELQNYLTQNSYLNVTSGDNRYLKLSGGTINSSFGGLEIKRNNDYASAVKYSNTSGVLGYIGFNDNFNPMLWDKSKGELGVILHSGNYSQYVLPLSGGTITGALEIKCGADNKIIINNTDGEGYSRIVFQENGSYIGQLLSTKDGNIHWGESKIWHSGNFNPSNYLPLSGGTINGNIQLGNDNNTSYYAMLVKQNGNVMSVGLDYGYGTLGYRESGTTNWNLLSVKNNDILCSFNGGNNWNTLIHSGNIGEYTIRYYGNQGAIDFDNVLYNGVQYTSGSSVNGGKHYGALMSLWAGDTAWQIVGGRANEGLMYRSGNGTSTSWSAWKTIAFTDSNVASATKLQTARTIWGQSFDGTSDVNGNILLGVGSDYVIGTGYSSSDKRTFNNITIGNSTTGIVYNGGTWTSSPSFNAHTFITGASSNALVINNSGNVGIGTTSPSSLLHVNGDGRITDIHFRGSYINLNRDGATSAIYDSTKTALEIEATSDVSILRTYNVTRQASIVLHTNGNIGIGTLSPSTKLHVAGDFRTNDVWIGSDTGTYIEGTQTGGLRIQYTNSENKYTQIHLKDLTVTINNNLLCSGGITMYSDQRKKTILNHVELSLKDIANAPLIEHYYNSDDKKTTHVGSIAQYWASMNDWFCKLDSEGYYTMEIQNAALASAISIARELDRYENKTDKAIKKLKKRIYELEEEVERLKAS